MKEYKFLNVYDFASLIDSSVRYGESFWNYNEDIFVEASSNFSKFTLLHLYIVTRAFNHYRRQFRKNGDCLDDEDIERWMTLFGTHKIRVGVCDLDDELGPHKWLEGNAEEFYELFAAIAEEVFHILFYNRSFLLSFNLLAADAIREAEYPSDLLNKKGRLKRTRVPEWLRAAVFHRDKGRCVYCNTDLTHLVNIISHKNFDHMVPLDNYGPNDPCNIQLACESCNKSKSNRDSSTGDKYQPWWY